MSERKYHSFKAFYPFYLTEHQDATSRTLHFIGTGLVIFLLFYAIAIQWWWGLALIPLAGYGFAWVGHFFFEKRGISSLRKISQLHFNIHSIAWVPTL